MSAKIDRRGARYGKLVVLDEAPERGSAGQIKWVCKCDCGSIASILTDNLRQGTTKSCGCLRDEAAINEVGNKYGKLKVIGRAERSKNTREARWLCICECGKEKIVSGKNLRSAVSASCGRCSMPFIVEEGGYSGHYLYNTWNGMLRRCYNANNPNFPDYGGIGIRVYKDWLNSPTSFYSWIDENLGSRPEGHSLDRVDVYGNYEPGNLKWSTSQEQMNNRRLVLLSEEEYKLIMQIRSGRLACEPEALCAEV